MVIRVKHGWARHWQGPGEGGDPGGRRGYLVPAQGNCDRDVQGLVDDPGDRFDQRHEEQREPDNTDEQDDDHPPHPVLDHLLLLLPPGLRVPLQQKGHALRRGPQGEAGGGRAGALTMGSALDWVLNLL